MDVENKNYGINIKNEKIIGIYKVKGLNLYELLVV